MNPQNPLHAARSLAKSFGCAGAGIVFCVKNERNMRIHVTAAAYVYAFAAVCRFTAAQYVVLTLTVCMVMGAEMMNTAVEAAVDMHAQGYDSLAKIAKDVAAGAVLVCAVGAAAVGCVMFFSPFSLGRIAAVFSSGPLPACLLAASVPAAALFIRRRRR